MLLLRGSWGPTDGLRDSFGTTSRRTGRGALGTAAGAEEAKRRVVAAGAVVRRMAVRRAFMVMLIGTLYVARSLIGV